MLSPLTQRSSRVVSAVKLHRSAGRRKAGEFLAEGPNAVGAALAAGRVTELFHTADADAELVAAARAARVPVVEITEAAARALGETVTPPGLVAVCRLLDVPPAQAAAGPLVVIPVAVADPGNAGTIVRIADAVGAHGVVFAGDCVDPHNGKCVRASAGSVFHLPIARERDIDLALDAAAGTGLQLLATAAAGETDLDDADELLSAPSAWLFGNEAHGLPDTVIARADHRIRLPIRGRAESYNLAAAAAICLYAAARAQASKRAGTRQK